MIEQTTEIRSNRQINAHTWLMALRSPEIAGQAAPGQFVMLRVRNSLAPLLRRPFSICCTRQEDILILYRVVGVGTRMMTGLREGEEVSVLGPLGRGFNMPGPKHDIILVSGGIGIAPLFAMAQALGDRKFSFLAGFQTAAEILLPEQIGQPSFLIDWTTDDGSRGRAGFVTELLKDCLDRQGEEGEGPWISACGPKAMLAQIAELVKGKDLHCEVSLEAHMACGLGACQGCAVAAAPGGDRPFYHVCQDGPVFPIAAIDWGGF